MWFNERYTLSRGRWEVPRIFLRIRSCTCRRFAFFDDCVSIASVLGHITREIARCARDDASRARASACSWATEQSEVVEWSRLKSSFRSRFSNLLLQSLARVADTFVLVRIRWTQSAHLRSNLSHFLAVDARHRQLSLLRIDRDVDARGQGILNRMLVAQAEDDHVLALEL